MQSNIRKLRLDDRDHPVYVLLSLLRSKSRFQPSDSAVVEIVGLSGFLNRREAHRHPEVARSQASQTNRGLKLRRHNADDCVRSTVEVDGLAQRMRIALIALLP